MHQILSFSEIPEQGIQYEITGISWFPDEQVQRKGPVVASLYLARKGELKQVRADRMPVAHHDAMKAFTNHEMTYEPGDMVYLYTDGYADQFGGSSNKKLNPDAFRKILLSVHEKPAEEQERVISSKFGKWKGQNDQLDDVTVIGMRI